ncbi:beta strand repeat-containing protein, partial [Pontimicrobium sp. MEBiC06410]
MLTYFLIIYSKIIQFFEEANEKQSLESKINYLRKNSLERSINSMLYNEIKHYTFQEKEYTISVLKPIKTIVFIMFISAISFNLNAQVITTWGGLSGTTPENNFQTSSFSAIGDGTTYVTVDITSAGSATTGGSINAVPPSVILTNSFNNSRATTGVSGNTYTYTFSEPVHVILSSQEHSELIRTENIKIASPDAGAAFNGELNSAQTGHFINNNNTSEIHIGSISSITSSGTYWTVQSNIAITTLTVEYYVTDGTEAATGEPFTLDLAPVPYIRLDDTNITGAGGINIDVPGCSNSSEFIDIATTGATSVFNAPHGLDFMTITLTNPQDVGNEELSIKGIFPGISVTGNGTTTLIVTNESADVNTLRNTLDDLVYTNSTATPETTTPRVVEINVTDPFGNTSATVTATITLTNPPNSGSTSGPLYVFTTDTTVDLVTALDGSQDIGGTWIDNDGTGALSGSVITVSSLPLGPSTFNYVVSGTGPCADAITTVLVIKLEGSEIALTTPAASSNCGTLTTSYTSAIFSANSDDPIFIFDGGAGTGQLECPAGGGGTIYDWYIYDAATNSYIDYAINSTRIQTGLADGGYLVVRNDGGTIEEGRAWVWNTQIQPDAGADVTACAGDTVNLSGIAANNPTFTYYDPVERPFKITSSTIFSVTFNVTHTYISDVGYYMVSPDGLVTIPLGINENGSPCYAADNAVNLTFTNDQTITPTLPVFDICEFSRNNACSGAGPALTGTYNAYYTDPSNNTTGCGVFSPAIGATPIDVTPFIGYDARQGGWKVQVYDCENLDVGEIDSVIISFSEGGNTSTFTSGTIPDGTPAAQINDGSCDPGTASIYEVPFTSPVVAGETLNIQNGVGLNSTGGYEWSYSTDSATGPWSTGFENATLTPSVVVNETTWFRLSTDNGTACGGEDVMQVVVTDLPVSGTSTDDFACAGDAVVDLNTLLAGADAGGIWSVSGSSTDNPGGDFNAGAGTYDPTTGGSYTFDYTVNAMSPCLINATTSVTVAVQAVPNAGTNNTITENTTSGIIDLFTNLLGSPDVGGTWSLNAGSDSPGANFDQGAGTLDSFGLITGTYIFDYTLTSCTTAVSSLTINFTVSVADTDGDGNPDPSDPNPGSPTANNDTATSDVLVPVIIDVLVNDDYLDNNDLTNAGVTTVTDTGTGTATGTISINPTTGEITYTPTVTEFGTNVTIIYEVCNDASGVAVCEQAIITITVTGSDIDSDGVPDISDQDDDNDGILDIAEGPGDPSADDDNDGVPNYLDDDPADPLVGDVNGTVEPAYDNDGDGVSNHLDLDADNDGIYDTAETGGTDANNDGIADGTPDPVTGIPSSAGTGVSSPTDTDGNVGENLPDFLDSDSDDDGCSDANEYYGENTADGGDGGQYGTDPAAVNANGTVVGASYPATGADSDSNTTADHLETGPDPDTDGIANTCDPDDDNDGNPDTTDSNPQDPTAVDDTATAMVGMVETIDILTNDDYLPDNTSTAGSDVYITDAGTGTGVGIITFDENTGELNYTPALSEGGMTVTVDYTVCNDLTGDGPTPDDVCDTATVTITVDMGPDADMDGIPDVVDQ